MIDPYYEQDGIQIFHGDCREILPTLSGIDLVVTSPPYDDLRDYGESFDWDFKSTADWLRVCVADGGVLVWVVGDQSKDGDESGNSFRQALYFKSIGFRLFDTMFYHKNGMPMRGNTRGYNQTVEYMFVFTVGQLKTSNLIRDRVNATAGKIRRTTNRKRDGVVCDQGDCHTQDTTRRENVWSYNTAQDSGRSKRHPAIFPTQLAKDHIISWSNKGDIVLDPFMGSGTTLVAGSTHTRLPRSARGTPAGRRD